LGKFNFAELTLYVIFKKTVFDVGQFEENQYFCVTFNITAEVIVEKTGKSTCQSARKIESFAVYFIFNCKSASFCEETFLNGKEDTSRLPKNSPELESGGARICCCKNAT